MDSNKVLKALFNVLALSAVAAAAFSCTVRQLDEDLQSAPNGERLEFTASIEDEAQTRSSVDANLNFYWSPGDQVSLFYGPSGNTAGSLFTAQNTEITQSTTFTGTISAFTGMGNDGVPLSFWSVSPYLASNRSDGNSVQATLPTVQQAVAENFASNTMLMVAKSYALSLSFKHVGAMLHIRMSRSDIVSVTFQGNAGETVAGRVSVTMDSSGKPVWSPINGQGSKYVMLKKPDGFVAGTYYYLYFLPQTFAQGWSLTFETRDGQTGTYTSNNSITFARAASRNVNNLDARVTTWEAAAEYVEMGPGIFWATKNVGADSPEEYGDYFAWGETTPKTTFSWNNYKWGTQTSFSRYVTKSSLGTIDNLTTLLPEDDAATVNLGGKWRTPTREEWKWLNDNCEWTRTDGGYLVTSNVQGYEGNSIFLPAGGCIYSSPQDVGSNGYYWSSTLDADSDGAYTHYLNIDASNSYHQESDDWRYPGITVRAVYDPSFISGHKYVEMGDGLKWATCNVGASKPEDYGDYFAWGETAAKTDYSWATYKWMQSGQSAWKYITKYTFADGKTEGIWYDGETFKGDNGDGVEHKELASYDYADDVARYNWDGSWRIPTDAEWTWLRENCTWSWKTTSDGYANNGMLVTSKVSGYEGNCIFLPAAGYRLGTSLNLAGSNGYYWSSSLSERYSDLARLVYFNSREVFRDYDGRYLGFSVRPVSD